jgi:hypothetical protein
MQRNVSIIVWNLQSGWATFDKVFENVHGGLLATGNIQRCSPFVILHLHNSSLLIDKESNVLDRKEMATSKVKWCTSLGSLGKQTAFVLADNVLDYILGNRVASRAVMKYSSSAVINLVKCFRVRLNEEFHNGEGVFAEGAFTKGIEGSIWAKIVNSLDGLEGCAERAHSLQGITLLF